jgi:hypothetical protein
VSSASSRVELSLNQSFVGGVLKEIAWRSLGGATTGPAFRLPADDAGSPHPMGRHRQPAKLSHRRLYEITGTPQSTT